MREAVLPIWKSHYSLGRSILTLEKKGSSKAGGPDSIIDICSEEGFKDFYLVDDSMGGFLEAYLNGKDAKMDLRFGLRISICDNCEQKNEESLNRTSKYVIFAKSKEGYQKLIKIYSYAAQNGFYYEPRISFKELKDLWSNKDLILFVPFYDSFLYQNTLYGKICIPEFDFCEPKFMLEHNDIPFNNIIKRHVLNYCKDKYEIVKTKSIYYKNKSDFKAYLTFRCINNRSKLDKPEFEHMTSNEFCFENWKEQNNG
jgi:DNA polymerase III alpha subunit